MKYNVIDPVTIGFSMYQTNTVDKRITPVNNINIKLVEDNSNNTLTGGVYHINVIKDAERASFVYSTHLNGDEENWYFEYQPSRGWYNQYTEYINYKEGKHVVTLTVNLEDITVEFFDVLQEYIHCMWSIRKVKVDNNLIKFILTES